MSFIKQLIIFYHLFCWHNCSNKTHFNRLLFLLVINGFWILLWNFCNTKVDNLIQYSAHFVHCKVLASRDPSAVFKDEQITPRMGERKWFNRCYCQVLTVHLSTQRTILKECSHISVDILTIDWYWDIFYGYYSI